MCNNIIIMEKNNKWTVYKHTSPSGKVYVGITNQPILKRWKNGLGYISCDGTSKEYPSIKECSIIMKIPATSIGRHLKSSKPYKIYKFSYKEEGL